jgi:hypothetical protein
MFIAKGESRTSQVETKNMSDDVKASAQRVRLSRGSPSSTRQLIRGAQTAVFFFFDVSGFKASFGRKCLTGDDKRPVGNSDIQVKNAHLSGPILPIPILSSVTFQPR